MVLGALRKVLRLLGYSKSPMNTELYSLLEGLKRGSYGPAAGSHEEGMLKLERRVRVIEGTLVSESPRTKKMKDRVKRLLRQHDKLTSDQLSTVIGLSRTRCNEYLKGLERDGMVTWYDEGKRRYYRLLEEMPQESSQ